MGPLDWPGVRVWRGLGPARREPSGGVGWEAASGELGGVTGGIGVQSSDRGSGSRGGFGCGTRGFGDEDFTGVIDFCGTEQNPLISDAKAQDCLFDGARSADRYHRRHRPVRAWHGVAGACSGTCAGRGGVLDARALAEYRRRLAELDDDLAEAERWNDTERASRARTERDFLLRELTSATGIHGHPRRLGSETERARVNVTRAIRSAIDRIRTHNPAAAAHLDQTVRTGTYCSYTAQR
jgi:hypothetical protein